MIARIKLFIALVSAWFKGQSFSRRAGGLIAESTLIVAIGSAVLAGAIFLAMQAAGEMPGAGIEKRLAAIETKLQPTQCVVASKPVSTIAIKAPAKKK